MPITRLSELQEIRHCALHYRLLKPCHFDNFCQQDYNHLEHLLLALPCVRQVDEKVAKGFFQVEYVSPINIMPMFADQFFERGCCDESQVVLIRVFKEIADRLQVVQVVHVGFQLNVCLLSQLIVTASAVKGLTHSLKICHHGMLLVPSRVVPRHLG